VQKEKKNLFFRDGIEIKKNSTSAADEMLEVDDVFFFFFYKNRKMI